MSEGVKKIRKLEKKKTSRDERVEKIMTVLSKDQWCTVAYIKNAIHDRYNLEIGTDINKLAEEEKVDTMKINHACETSLGGEKKTQICKLILVKAK